MLVSTTGTDVVLPVVEEVDDDDVLLRALGDESCILASFCGRASMPTSSGTGDFFPLA